MKYKNLHKCGEQDAQNTTAHRREKLCAKLYSDLNSRACVIAEKLELNRRVRSAS